MQLQCNSNFKTPRKKTPALYEQEHTGNLRTTGVLSRPPGRVVRAPVGRSFVSRNDN